MTTSDSIEPAVSSPAGEGTSNGPVLSLGSAKLLACRKWSAGTAGVVGHRVGFAVLRRKSVVKRYEVGYRTLVSVTPAEAQAELCKPW